MGKPDEKLSDERLGEPSALFCMIKTGAAQPRVEAARKRQWQRLAGRGWRPRPAPRTSSTRRATGAMGCRCCQVVHALPPDQTVTVPPHKPGTDLVSEPGPEQLYLLLIVK